MTGSGTLRYLRPLALMAVGASLVACGQSVESPRPAHTDDIHHKPSAPVHLQLSSVAGASGTYWVTATATPSVNTTELEIVIDGVGQTHVETFAKVAAGETRSTRARFSVGMGGHVRASARTVLGPRFAPNKVAELTLGTPRPRRAVPIRTISLPGGEQIDEVR